MSRAERAAPAGSVRIVVGHSLDDAGDDALREAVSISDYAVVQEIVVVHALEDDYADQPSRVAAVSRASSALVEHLASAGPGKIPLRSEIRFGRAGAVLDEVARELGGDLVIVGGQRHHGGGRVRGGSTAAELQRTSAAPVLIAHPRHLAVDASVQALRHRALAGKRHDAATAAEPAEAVKPAEAVVPASPRARRS